MRKHPLPVRTANRMTYLYCYKAGLAGGTVPGSYLVLVQVPFYQIAQPALVLAPGTSTSTSESCSGSRIIEHFERLCKVETPL